MDVFPLQLFPPGSLSESVITTVWVGVVVISFFNLRLGWAYSGLIIPGYLVPLLIAKPWSALLIVVEGVLTYLIGRAVSELPSMTRYWSGFFGRDRFFLLLLISVGVRVFVDGVAAPWVGEQVRSWYHVEFDYRNNLHSYGLVIVSLIANQFWGAGLRRGLPPFAVVVGITWALVRFGLMEYTNFNIGSLEYLYENTASSLLASPKSYIILLITAFVASRMNLLYGWDFNGILIPSLLALLWYQPTKILTSFVEAGVVLVVGLLVLRLPSLRQSTIEGARKVLLFFNICFAYKLVLGFLLVAYLPSVKVTDAYGFGYLLATLMAVKAHEKGIAARLTRATLQVSFVSAALASVIGFAITFLPLDWMGGWTEAGVRPEGRAAGAAAARRSQARLIDVMRRAKVSMYRTRVPDSVPVPLPGEMDLFAEGVGELLAHAKAADPERLARGRERLGRLRYRVDEVQERYLVLREEAPQRGWGIYVLDARTPAGMLVEVPAPIDEWATMEAGILCFQQFQGGALAVGGAGRKTNRDGSSDVLSQPRTLFYAFHRLLSRRNVLQVRGYTSETVRALRGERAGPEEIDVPDIGSSLWIKSRVPTGLNLSEIKKIVDPLRIEWGRTPWPNAPRDGTWEGFAELLLNRADCRALLVRSLYDIKIEAETNAQRIDGYLLDSLLGKRGRIATSGTDLYLPPDPEDLLFLDEAVLTPILKRVRPQFRNGAFTPDGEAELRAVIAAAGVFDYRVLWYRNPKPDQDFLILDEQETPPRRRYWGTYVFRLGSVNPYLVQVPRPVYEINSVEYGVGLFHRMRADTLLVAGTHPNANRNGRADMIQGDNKVNLFNLANQVVMREAGDLPMLVIQSRAFGQKSFETLLPAADALLALHDGAPSRDAISLLARGLVDALEADELQVRFVDGSTKSLGYEVGGIPQAAYLPQTTHKEFAVLWLSPLARLSYRPQSENRQQELQFRALDIPTVEADLVQHVLSGGARQGFGPVPDGLRALIARYHANQDMVALRMLKERWSALRLERVVDRDSKQSFLLIHGDPSRLPLVINLSPRPEVGDRVIVGGDRSPDLIQRFIDSRSAWLEFREKS